MHKIQRNIISFLRGFLLYRANFGSMKLSKIFYFDVALQFVNFTKIMSENSAPSKKETDFALAALMEIPLQYRATQTLNIK